MSASNLNESQKHILRWLVNQCDLGKLDENDITISWSFDGTSIIGYDDEVPEISETTLDAFELEGFMICSRHQHSYQCSLTGAAATAVRNNFQDSGEKRDDSFSTYLNGLVDIEHLDKELKERCLYSISSDPENPIAWDKAIRTATVILENRIRKTGNTDKINSDATGETIVNIAFGRNGTLVEKLGTKKAKAYRDLYSGLMLVFRNHYNHRLVDPNPSDGAAIIQFINLALKMLDNIKD